MPHSSARVARALVALLALGATVQFGFIVRQRTKTTPAFAQVSLGDTLRDVRLEVLRITTADAGDVLEQHEEWTSLHRIVPEGGCSLIVFYSPTCPGCVMQGRDLISAIRSDGPGYPPVEWVAVNGTPEALSAFLDTTGVRQPVLRLADNKDVFRLGVTSVPYGLMLTADAVVRGFVVVPAEVPTVTENCESHDDGV